MPVIDRVGWSWPQFLCCFLDCFLSSCPSGCPHTGYVPVLPRSVGLELSRTHRIDGCGSLVVVSIGQRSGPSLGRGGSRPGLSRCHPAIARSRGASSRASRREYHLGLATAGVSAFCLPTSWLPSGEHSGTLDMIAPAFMANPPRWWWAVSHSWTDWLLAAAGLLPSSVALRRGRLGGYIVLAAAVTY